MKKLILLIILVIGLNVSIGYKFNEVKASEGPKPGTVSVTWTIATVTVCPPGVLGTEACRYPNPIDVIKQIMNLIMTISPSVLVILLILGGLVYLLTPIDVKKVALGHRYIQYAVIGYIILLLITLIFSLIGALFGGPRP